LLSSPDERRWESAENLHAPPMPMNPTPQPPDHVEAPNAWICVRSVARACGGATRTDKHSSMTAAFS
jgi:hypothetical protein